MRIGIDLDDTTFYTYKSMIKYADIYDTKILGRKGSNGNLGLIQNRYYLKHLYGWTDEEKQEFFRRYYKNILEECEPMENSSEIINKLKENNEIYFVTARLTNVPDCNTDQITKESLKRNNISYDELISNASDKLAVCKDQRINIFIEDSYDTCKELEENGIKAFLMTTPMNKNIDSGNVERVNNWKEIYDKLKKIGDIY